MVSMMPVLCARTERSDKVFQVLAWISFGFSSLAFLFMIGIWGVAKSRFEKRGFSATYGNLVSLHFFNGYLLFLIELCISLGCLFLRLFCCSRWPSVHISLRRLQSNPRGVVTQGNMIPKPVRGVKLLRRDSSHYDLNSNLLVRR